ncbi:ROK family protein [Pigmentiphaga sp.]|uniref:ROK family protein n=1 Tax=Pigmentiphaga sp. TaxID=1977564 RepID=UPI00128C5FBE|nr:ROK family protein [Pigmentiphaga sp.]MPS28654.1 ROK family protein [Alcaligenaceae bacterium SAGV5]MPS52399.1 ROK family protein [Alcaligenaceae bacterium SAGV3]MPT58130.1 ROK family protein [Alcaligenaceae bacterium]
MKAAPGPGILAVDIGGTGLKAAVIDEAGRLLGAHLRVPTPRPCPPDRLLEEIASMAASLGAYDRISIGFPGVVRRQRVLTAVNLGSPSWVGFPLAQALGDRLGCPARMVNDADMQGYGLAQGEGLEFVMTLGTGVGTALFRDGRLMPHLELAHHPMMDGKTYEECLGDAALRAEGRRRWNRLLSRALALIDILLTPDRIHLGGGNAREVDAGLPPHVSVGSNDAGLMGGAALWRSWDPAHA